MFQSISAIGVFVLKCCKYLFKNFYLLKFCLNFAIGWFNASHLREENGEKEAYDLLTEAFEQHELSLLKQLLLAKGVSSSWSDVLIPLTREIVAAIRPDKNHDAIELDIRNYVQIKKLPGGSRTDTHLVNGIVCSKNVAHKEMATDIENPRILLLQCPIMYQRTEGRLMSLEPVLMQVLITLAIIYFVGEINIVKIEMFCPCFHNFYKNCFH